MRVGAMIGAAVAAVVGALIWGLISWKTGFEIGYVAWGIGIAVGVGSSKLGGRGASMGVYCGLLAFAAIFCGKLLAVEFSLEGQLREVAHDYFTRDLFNDIALDAKAFTALPDENSYQQFIFDRGYFDDAGVTQVADVTQDHIDVFKNFSIPMLQQINDGSLTFEDWQRMRTEDFISGTREGLSRMEVLKDNFSPFDLLWAFLGISTAFKIGGASDESTLDEEDLHRPDDLLTQGFPDEGSTSDA